MKKFLLAIGAIALLSGCDTESAKREDLTASELDKFNDVGFFNNEEVSGYNFANQFIKVTYDDVKDIDLGLLFYNGAYRPTPTLTAEEESAIIKAQGYEDDGQGLPIAALKLLPEEMSEVLEKYTGITFEETNKVGLDNYIYLEEFDAYYLLRSDSTYLSQIEFTSGYTIGNHTYLVHSYNIMPNKCATSTLKLVKHNDTYLIDSNKCND